MALGRVPATGSLDDAARTGRWAVRLAAGTVAVLGAAYAVVGVALLTGGQDAISDNWAGYLGGVALVGGLAASLIAFALAVVTWSRRRQARPLWLPLALLPSLVLVVAAAELFWME